MANYIQIRRSNTSSSPANTLTSGELAYTYAANTLYIGAQTGISGAGFKVGGAKYIYLDRASVGNLTANAVVIADGNSFVSNTFTSGLVISESTASPALVVNSISDANYSNTVLGTLQGNNELVTANAIAHYVQTSILSGGVYANGAPSSGSNGAIQYNDQSTGFNTIAGAPNMIYDNVAGTLKVGNTSSYVLSGYITDLHATQENLGNQNNYVQAMIHNDNTGIEASADWVAYNDDQSYSSFIDMGIVSTNYSNAASTITPAGTSYLYTGNSSLVIGTANANYVSIFTGGTLAANERMRFDSTGNVAIGTTDTSNATFIVKGTAEITGGLFANGGLGSNGYVLHSNGTSMYWDSPVAGAAGANAQITYNDSGYANGSTSFTFDNSSNTLTVNGTINTVAISANGSLGSDGQALHSNGTSLYWANVTAVAGSNTYIQFNDSGLTNATAGFTFDKTINALSLGTTSVGYSVNFADSNTYLAASGNNIILTTGAAWNNGYTNRVAIGNFAGDNNQNSYAIAIGSNTGQNNQRYGAIAMGQFAGYDHQHIFAVAIGANSGAVNQLWDSIAIGRSAAELNQGSYSIAMGRSAGANNQLNTAVAIGNYAASNTQGVDGIAIGSYAGNESQQEGAVAIGADAGSINQGQRSVAVGKYSANINQGSESVAIGYEAGQANQGQYSVSVGSRTALESQAQYAIAVGANSGQIYQGQSAVALGRNAGQYNQQDSAIAIGAGAGQLGQGQGSIAIGLSDSQGQDEGQYGPTFNSGATTWLIDVSGDSGELDYYVAKYVENNDKKVYVSGPGVDMAGTYIVSGSAGTYVVNRPALDNSSGNITITFGGQGENAISIGTYAADSFQGSNSIAIGHGAASTTQGISAIAIGTNAGANSQQDFTIAIGANAGANSQQVNAVAIGLNAGLDRQQEAVAIGPDAGYNNQRYHGIAIGAQAGSNNQYWGSIAIGRAAGTANQSSEAIALGHQTGALSQNTKAIAIGGYAGYANQGANSIAIGFDAGNSYQSYGAVAIGLSAGATSQGYETIAIGESAGANSQTYQAVAIGYNAGANTQSERAVAIGYYAGSNTQGIKAVAIGRSAGEDQQGQDAVALGHRAGQSTQAYGAIAIGRYAGQINQGSNSIAIGVYAGQTNQVNNSIILNASGSALDATTTGLFINPVRNLVANSFMYYNPSTKEITYASADDLPLASSLSVGNSTVNTVINSTSITTANVRAGKMVSGSYERNYVDLSVNAKLYGGNYGVQIQTSNSGGVGAANSFVWDFSPDDGSLNAPGVINATSFTINGNLTANSLGIYLGTGSYLNAASVNATSLGVNGDAIITGNLTVQGTLTTIDTTQVAIADINLKLASNNAGDVVDFGLYGQYKVGTNTYFSGLFRDHTMGDANNAVYHLYSTNTEPGMTSPYVVDGTANGYHLSTLMSYLDTGKGFVANSTTVALTANATVNVAITANTLHLSSALPANSGGTGLATYLAGDIVYASGTYDGGGQTSTTLTTLSVPIAAANDQILMIKNNIPAYSDTIDGGTF